MCYITVTGKSVSSRSIAMLYAHVVQLLALQFGRISCPTRTGLMRVADSYNRHLFPTFFSLWSLKGANLLKLLKNACHTNSKYMPSRNVSAVLKRNLTPSLLPPSAKNQRTCWKNCVRNSEASCCTMTSKGCPSQSRSDRTSPVGLKWAFSDSCRSPTGTGKQRT